MIFCDRCNKVMVHGVSYSKENNKYKSKDFYQCPKCKERRDKYSPKFKDILESKMKENGI